MTATLLGQCRRYWSGEYSQVTEWNPVAGELLRLHPLAFVAAAAASCVIVVAAVFLLNQRLALALTFAVTFGHTVGAAAWAARAGAVGVAAAVVMLVATERLVTYTWRTTEARPE